MKFSVLISVYYKEIPQYLDQALNSITDGQLLKPNEIVLVKDGPLTKDLDKVIDKYQSKYPEIFKIIFLNENFGLGKALNIGLLNCTYNLVARMDGDDISKPERFKEQIKIFKENLELVIVGSWIDEFDIEDNKMKIKSTRKVPEKTIEIYNELKFKCAFNHPSVMYKKDKILEVESYTQEFLLEDYYLWIKLARKKYEMFNIQKSLLYFRMNKNTFKRRGGIKLLLNDIKFQKKLYKIRFINFIEFLRNILIWGVYRIIPLTLREKIQQSILRRNKI